MFFNRKFNTFSVKEFLAISWLVYLLGIFVAPSFKGLNNIYYVLIFPGAIFLIVSQFSNIIKSELFLPLGVLALWSLFSVSWAESPDYGDIKSIFYVLCFIVFISMISEEEVLGRWGWMIPVAMMVQLFLSGFKGSVLDGRLHGSGVMEHPLYAGQYYLFFFWFFLHYKQYSIFPKFSVFTRIVGLMLSVAGCVLTQSRSAVACIVVLLFLLFLFYGNARLKKYCVGLFCTISIIFLAVSASNNWYVFPATKVSYSLSMGSGDSLLVGSLGKGHVKKLSVLMGDQLIRDVDLLEQDGKIHIVAKVPGEYKVAVVFSEKTVIPWRYLLIKVIDVSEDKGSFTLFKPPRIFQFDPTFNHRAEIWSERLRQSWEKPIFGHGFSDSRPVIFGNNYQVNDAHNFFLGTLFHLGVVGLFLYVTVLFIAVARLVQGREWSFLALLICGLITTSFDDEDFFTSSRPYWCLMLIPLGKALSLTLKKKSDKV